MATAPDIANDASIKRETALATLDKARLDARKSLADAQTSEATSQLALLKAAIGEVPSSGFTGAITPNEGTGLPEQNALAIKGLAVLARDIVAVVKPKLATASPAPTTAGTAGAPAAPTVTSTTAATVPGTPPASTTTVVAPAPAPATGGGGATLAIYLLLGDALPSTAAARSYSVHTQLIESALNKAIELSTTIGGTGGAAASSKGFIAAPLAAAGLLLSGISSILTYAKTDSALGGRELKPSDRSLISLIARDLNAVPTVVRIGETSPPLDPATITKLVEELGELAELAGQARIEAVKHEAAIKRLTPAPPPLIPPATPPPDPDPNGEKPGHERAKLALDDAIGMFDEFLKAMFADQAGAPAIIRVGEARELDTFLASARILQVTLDAGYGSYLSKKGVVNSIRGNIDLEVSALVSASWRLLDPKTLQICAAGVASHLAPYTAIADVKMT